MALLDELRTLGWNVEPATTPRALPSQLLSRYPWFPDGYKAIAQHVERAIAPGEQAWLLTALEYSGQSDSSFAWNEWELQSLEAARDDEAWQDRVRAFWDDHLPIALSVKGGYGYWAIERSRLEVVCGEAPEFEETTLLAQSVEELLDLLAPGDERLKRWR